MHRLIQDEDIEAAIGTLCGVGRWGRAHYPSVREVARELERRYGASGTRARICDALRQLKSRAKDAVQVTAALEGTWEARALELQEEFARYRFRADARIDGLEAELQSMRERAERAEAREDSSTQRWLMEIDGLRQQLLAAKAGRLTGVPYEKYLALYRELAALRGAAGIVEDDDGGLDGG